MQTELLLGVDGGGSGCRARLAEPSGSILGEGSAGPANIRFGLEPSFAAVLEATMQCLYDAGLSYADLERTVACLALAGATEPTELAKARAHSLPFRKTVITTDAHAACIGAHGGRDGGIVIVGTGSVDWAMVRGRHLVAPDGDALSGALQLAQAEASSMLELIGAGDLSPGSAELIPEAETESALSPAHDSDEDAG